MVVTGMESPFYKYQVIVSEVPSDPAGCRKLNDSIYHCGTLKSLLELLKYESESVDVFIAPESYNLTSSHSNIDTGIKFIHSSDLIIEFINFRWCGMKHKSTSQVRLGMLRFVYFRSALYFNLPIVQT